MEEISNSKENKKINTYFKNIDLPSTNKELYITFINDNIKDYKEKIDKSNIPDGAKTRLIQMLTTISRTLDNTGPKGIPEAKKQWNAFLKVYNQYIKQYKGKSDIAMSDILKKEQKKEREENKKLAKIKLETSQIISKETTATRDLADKLYKQILEGKASKEDNVEFRLAISRYESLTGREYLPPAFNFNKMKNKVVEQSKKVGNYVKGKVRAGIEYLDKDDSTGALSAFDYATHNDTRVSSSDNSSGTSLNGGLKGDTFNGGRGRAFGTKHNGKRAVQYPDGSLKVGGSRSWRNNNPGNIHATKTSLKKYNGCGADYVSHTPGVDSNVMIFCSMKDGIAAQRKILRGPYGNETLLTFGRRYQTKHSAYGYASNILNALAKKKKGSLPFFLFC
jgi:hypothetical protein